MNALLLDTNVLLDYHLADRPGHADAFALIDAALKNDYPLLVASHSLKDFWYIFWQSSKLHCQADGSASLEQASKIAKRMAWACTEQISHIATVVASDASDAWLAIKMHGTHDDYEDNLLVAAAMRAKPRLLVTNDQELIAHSPVATATPKDALAFLDFA